MTDMADNPELRMRERGPGAVLAAARTAQNLSLDDVARQLKLSVSQVAALEAGAYGRLPGPVFVRGFVRNYARLLKVDPDRVLGMLEEAPGREVPNQMPTARGVPFPTQKPRRWPRVALLAALLAVVALGAYEFYWQERAPASPASETRVVTEVAPTPPAAPASAAETNAPTMETKPPAIETSAPVPSDRGAAGATAAREGEGELRFVFTRDSWVQVRDGTGRLIMTRVQPAGSEQRLVGKPPFSVVIGNARGVQLSYNERPVDLKPHTVRDDVARLRLP